MDVETLIDAFNNTTLTRERGIYFDECNYTCLRSDDDSIYAKEVSLVVSLAERVLLRDSYLYYFLRETKESYWFKRKSMSF